MISEREREIYSLSRKTGRFLYHYTGDRSGQRRVLLKLERYGELTQRALQEILDIKSSSMSEALKRMEKDGLIEKKRSEKDARVVLVRLTPRGEKLAALVKSKLDRITERLYDVLDDQERDDFLIILEKLNDHFDALKQDETFINLERGKTHD